MAVEILTISTPSPKDFGGCKVGSTKDMTVALAADAGNTRNVVGTASVTGSGWSVVAGASYNIAPGGTHNVTVRFTPTLYQTYTSTNGFSAAGDQTNGTQAITLVGWGGSETYQIRISDKRTKGGDLVKVTLEFSRTDGGLFTKDFNLGDDVGVRLLDSGRTSWKLDLEKLWIQAGFWTLRLGDYHADAYLADLFWEDGFTTGLTPSGVDRRPSVKLEIKYGSTGSYVTEFLGNVVDEDGARRENGVAGKIVTLTVAPKLDVLNRTILYKDSVAQNPFGYTQNTYRHLQSMIEDIFELVDPAVAVSFDHGWEYKAQYGTNPWHYDVVFSEIYQYVNELYFEDNYNLETVGDVLRKIAIDWGAVAGMVHGQKAFFRSIFRSQPSSKFSPGRVLSDEWAYTLPVFRYVKVVGANGHTAEEGTPTTQEGEYLERAALPNFYGDGSSGYSHVIALHAGGEGPSGRVDVYGAKDSEIDSTYRDSDDHQAKFWYHYRGDKTKGRVRRVEFLGLNCSVDKMMEYASGDYLVLTMDKEIDEGRVTVEGLLLP